MTWWKIVAQIAALAYGLFALAALSADEELDSGTAPARISTSNESVSSPKASVRVVYISRSGGRQWTPGHAQMVCNRPFAVDG